MKRNYVLFCAALLLVLLGAVHCSRGTEKESAAAEQQKPASEQAAPADTGQSPQQRQAELDRREAELNRREAEVGRRQQPSSSSRRVSRPAPRRDVAGRDVDVNRPAPPAPVARSVVVPAGTQLRVRMADRLDTRTTQAGERFRAILDQDLVVGGQLVARVGSDVEGRVVESTEAGRVKGRSELSFTLTELNAGGRSYRIVTDTKHMRAESSVKEDATVIGGTTGAGAAIGAIAKGKKGAAVGAAVGAAAGTAAVLSQRGKYIEVRPETEFSFRLQDDLVVRQ